MASVDIIIATYKRHELLQKALASIAAQSFPHWRCWIAEDGESRETYDAVQPFLRDHRFVYLPGKHAGFPAVPRNRGIRQGNAPYVALLDDDDFWLPEKLEHQVGFLDKHPACALLGCNAFLWNGRGAFHEAPLQLHKKETLGKISYAELVNQNCLNCSAVMIQRDALEKSGLFNENPSLQPGQDYELWLRLGALGEVFNMREPLVICLETPSTHYKKNPDRQRKYQSFANIYSAALEGTGGKPSPLSHPKNDHLAYICQRQRDFYLAGPRFLGRLRHEMSEKIKFFLSETKSYSHTEKNIF